MTILTHTGHPKKGQQSMVVVACCPERDKTGGSITNRLIVKDDKPAPLAHEEKRAGRQRSPPSLSLSWLQDYQQHHPPWWLMIRYGGGGWCAYASSLVSVLRMIVSRLHKLNLHALHRYMLNVRSISSYLICLTRRIGYTESTRQRL